MTHSTILLVDDDPDVSDALATTLRAGGYEVITAHDGSVALRRLMSGLRPDLILLDLMMPIMDGYEFRAAQMADPALRDIPTVVLTAGSVDARARSLGAAAVLQKPIDIDALLAVVRRHQPQ